MIPYVIVLDALLEKNSALYKKIPHSDESVSRSLPYTGEKVTASNGQKTI